MTKKNGKENNKIKLNVFSPVADFSFFFFTFLKEIFICFVSPLSNWDCDFGDVENMAENYYLLSYFLENSTLESLDADLQVTIEIG